MVVVAASELVLEIEDESLTTGHSGAEVFARGSQDHDGAAGHVLTTVITDPLHDGRAARVADAEAFTRTAVGKEMAGDGSVHDGVADDAVILGDEAVIGHGSDDDLSAAHAFANVVVPLARQDEFDTRGKEGAEALSRGAGEIKLQGALGQPFLPVLVGDFSGDLGDQGTVRVVDLVRKLHGLGVTDALLGILQDDIIKRLVMLGIVPVARGITDGRGIILHHILEEA